MIPRSDVVHRRRRLKTFLDRDLWNLCVSRCWSRRIRRLWLQRSLARLGVGSFCGLNVTLLNPARISLGARIVVNSNCILDGRECDLIIGDDVDIGTHTHIWTLEHDPNDENHGTKGGAVTIEDHVWIASRVTILPGVTIGRGAVISCGAVVTRNVEPLTIVAGVPARQIGERQNSLKYKLSYAPRFR